MEIIIGWIFFSILVGAFWNSKGKSFAGGFFISLALSPLVGFIIGLVLKPDVKHEEQKAILNGSMRKCPFCAELVKSEAVICRYCGKELPKLQRPKILIGEKGKFICPYCKRVLYLSQYKNLKITEDLESGQTVKCRFCHKDVSIE